MGAEGLSQFMPGTWKTWGRDDDGNGSASPYDPGDAIMAQGRYDCDLAERVERYEKAGKVSGEPSTWRSPRTTPGRELLRNTAAFPPYTEPRTMSPTSSC